MEDMHPMRGSDAFKELCGLNRPWRKALPLAQKHAWPKGYKVKYGRSLYFLERGLIRMAQQNLDGQEKIVWFIGPDCIFGETPFFDTTAIASYFSCASRCVVYAFPEAAVRWIMAENPDLVFNLFCSMAHKMRYLVRQAASLYLDNALERLCKFLEKRIMPGSDPPMVVLDMSRQEIASFLGINRCSLYKLLREQEEKGLFRLVSRRRILIAQPDIFFAIVTG